MKKPKSLVKDNLLKLIKGMKTLSEQAVYVGVPADEAPRKDEESDNAVNNATLAYIHENGAPAANIPARPFLRPGLESCKGEVAAELKMAASQALASNPTAVDRGLHRAGMVAQNAIRRELNDGEKEPLAPLTLAARRRRGRTGEKPLIDTGQLRNSITYVVRRK